METDYVQHQIFRFSMLNLVFSPLIRLFLCLLMPCLPFFRVKALPVDIHKLHHYLLLFSDVSHIFDY